jgi:hypothetical protein
MLARKARKEGFGVAGEGGSSPAAAAMMRRKHSRPVAGGARSNLAAPMLAATPSTFDAVRAVTGYVRPRGNHGCQPAQIVPGLWTAHFGDIADRTSLLASCPGATHVVNCAIHHCPTGPGFYGPGITVQNIDILDDPDPRKAVDAMEEGPAKVAAKAALPVFDPAICAGDVADFFETVNSVIDEAFASGGACVVHCHASLSRSAAFIIAWLVAARGMSAVEATATMKAQWDAVWPNDQFVRSIVQYETACNTMAFS